MKPSLLPAMLLVFAISCAPVPMPTSMPTATLLPIVTALPAATVAPIPTSTLTPIPTPAPTNTPTITPTATVKPTETLERTATPDLNRVLKLLEQRPIYLTWSAQIGDKEDGVMKWNSPAWTSLKDDGTGKFEYILNDPDLERSAYKYTALKFGTGSNPVRSSLQKEGEQLTDESGHPLPVDWSVETIKVFGSGFITSKTNTSIDNIFFEITNLHPGQPFMVMSAIEIGPNRLPVLIVRDPEGKVKDRRYTVRGLTVVNDNVPIKFRQFTIGKNIYLAINDNVLAEGELFPQHIGRTPEMYKSGAYSSGSDVGSWVKETGPIIQFRKQ